MNPSCFIIVAIFGTLATNVFASYEQGNDTRLHNHHSGLNITGLNFTRLDDPKHHNGLDLDSSSMVQNDEEIADNHDVKRIWFVVARRPGFASGLIPNFFENSSFVGFNFTSPLSNLPTFDDVKNSTSSLTSNLGRYLPSFQRQRRSSNYVFPILPSLAPMHDALNQTSNQQNETMAAFSNSLFPLLSSIANISAIPSNPINNQTNETMAANSTSVSPFFPFLIPSLNITKSAERQRRSLSNIFPQFPSFTTVLPAPVVVNPVHNPTNESMAFNATLSALNFLFPFPPPSGNISSMSLNHSNNQSNATISANTTTASPMLPFLFPSLNITKRSAIDEINMLFGVNSTCSNSSTSPIPPVEGRSAPFGLDSLIPNVLSETYAEVQNNSMALLHTLYPSIYRKRRSLNK